MHRECFQFVRRALEEHNPTGKHVVELGSFIVNGSVRPLFTTSASYVGVDVRPGDGVDRVGDAATWQPDARVDIVVTTEMLEHAPRQREVIHNIAKMLVLDGVLILTAAGVERQPHGNNGGALADDEFYANVNEVNLAAWLNEANFASFVITRDTRAGDVYCLARR